MAEITSVNAIYLLSIPPLFTIPQLIQGWSADDAFMTDEIDTKELYRGIDGRLSVGLVLNPVPQTITLSADSPSTAIFDYWNAQEVLNQRVFFCSAVIQLPAIGTKYTLVTGTLRRYRPIPDAAKTLRPRVFGMTFESCFAAPITGAA